MIHRPNVRARIYRPNLQTRYEGNQKFSKRNFKIFTKQCSWCKRPNYFSAFDYPGLCVGCARYINALDGLPVHIKMNVEYQDWPINPDIPF